MDTVAYAWSTRKAVSPSSPATVLKFERKWGKLLFLHNGDCLCEENFSTWLAHHRVSDY